MIVSIAELRNDERIFGVGSRRWRVLPVVFSTQSLRGTPCAYRVLARPTKCSLFALRAIQLAISLTASCSLLDSNEDVHCHTRAQDAQVSAQIRPSHLAVIVLIDFACMTLLVLLSL
jgi:hypothetical protein